jgi:Fe-S-cluster containining protein
VSRPPSPLPLPLLRADAGLTVELRRLYDELEQDLAEVGASCAACGDCCHLAEFGHELWLTNLELMYLVDRSGARPLAEPGVCPYLESGRCAAHRARALSCRVFHCELSRGIQERLHEAYLEGLARLAAREGVELAYGELLASLAALAGDQTGSRPRTSE